MAEPVDIALVSLGTTPGLRRADETFAALCAEAGLQCQVVPVEMGRSGSLRRQTTVTDIVEARAARSAGSGVTAKVVIYSTVTAALLQKPKGRYAVRFDSPAAGNRPGLSGRWSRGREAKVLANASLLLPWGNAALKLVPPDARKVPAIALPVPIEAAPPAERSATIAGVGERDIDALAYAGNPEKRGLDILIPAWNTIRTVANKRLRITGIERNRAIEWLRKHKIDEPPGVEWSGLLDPGGFRYTLSRTKLFINASRHEDHGLSQLEALAAGAALVTVPSEGPYEALPMAMQLDRALVAPSLSRESLAFAIRSGFNVDLDDYGARAAELLKPYTPEAVREVFTERVLPALGL